MGVVFARAKFDCRDRRPLRSERLVVAGVFNPGCGLPFCAAGADGVSDEERAQACAFAAIGFEQGCVAGDAVGPVSGAAAFSLAAQGAGEAADDMAAAVEAQVGDLMRPEREKLCEFGPAQAVAMRGGVCGFRGIVARGFSSGSVIFFHAPTVREGAGEGDNFSNVACAGRGVQPLALNVNELSPFFMKPSGCARRRPPFAYTVSIEAETVDDADDGEWKCG